MQPYLLKETAAYEAWREQKLNNYPKCEDELIIELNNPINLVDNEINAIISACAKTNMALYRCASKIDDPKQVVISLAQQCGLNQLDSNICADEDRISAIQDTAHKQNKNSDQPKSHYIPYTNKPLNWHTDGYYNAKEQRIHAFLMHCVRPAKSGGENSYLDPEIAYILLRDENPNYITALMQDDVMMIPANEKDAKQIRAAQTGPVFFTDNDATLCMRYTARQKNIVWKQDEMVQSALAFMQEILQDNPYMFHYSLNAGEGVICNNVLHKRTAFEDDQEGNQEINKKRLLYRARFYNRIASNQTPINQAVKH